MYLALAVNSVTISHKYYMSLINRAFIGYRRMLLVKVKILPEVLLSDPLEGALPLSRYKLRVFSQSLFSDSSTDQSHQPKSQHHSVSASTSLFHIFWQ